MTYYRKDGGAAFPSAGVNNGMTLRDWFAGQVIASVKGWHPADRQGKNAAQIAYEVADAMLAAREEK